MDPQATDVGAGYRRTISPELITAIAIGIDALSVLVSARFAQAIYDLITSGHLERSAPMGASVVLALVFAALMRSRGLYEPGKLMMLERQLKAASIAWVAAFALVLVFAFLLKSGEQLSRGTSGIHSVLGLFVILATRVIWPAALRRAIEHGLVRRRNAVLLSSLARQAGGAQSASLHEAGIETVQTFALPPDAEGRANVLARVIGYARTEAVDEVIVVIPSDDLSEVEPVVEALRPLPLPIRLLPDVVLSRLALQPSRPLGGFALIDLAREPLTASERGLKRALDIAVAALGLIASAPLVALAIVAIKLDTPGPALFRQTRRGFNGRSFKILKLRTMSVLEDGDGIAQATRRDPRVTRVGAWLRRTSIDELPQLWNVLRGEMSIVGPRPHAVAHDELYDPMIDGYAFRHHVKPGLTGWAQVNGFRGETPKVALMAARVDHDIWYINNWSLLLDVRILVLTCTRLFARSAY